MEGKLRVADLFCGAGGASKGYLDAGFDVFGVDLELQPRYITPNFIQGDAMVILEGFIAFNAMFGPFDLIHASPPCQSYSHLSVTQPGVQEKYPRLIDPVRELLQKTGIPYVIENVPGAPLIDPVVLCGSHFPSCTTMHPEYGRVGLRRHRRFETSFWVPSPGKCDHSLRSVPVYGHGSPGNGALKGPGLAKASREVMGIDWMNRDELVEAIPPVFTEYVGLYARAAILSGNLTAA